MPATCAGEPLGVLLVVFDGEPALGSGALRALATLGTALGLALMQERLLTDEPGDRRKSDDQHPRRLHVIEPRL